MSSQGLKLKAFVLKKQYQKLETFLMKTEVFRVYRIDATKLKTSDVPNRSSQLQTRNRKKSYDVMRKNFRICSAETPGYTGH
jgi:hypothetical protein